MQEIDPKALAGEIKAIVATEGKQRTRLINIVRKVQHSYGQVSDLMIDLISEALEIERIEVEGVISFYHFLSKEKLGRHQIYLNNSAVSEMMGFEEVAQAFKEAAGIDFGETTTDGLISLRKTSCIGMSDQEPAASDWRPPTRERPKRGAGAREAGTSGCHGCGVCSRAAPRDGWAPWPRVVCVAMQEHRG